MRTSLVAIYLRLSLEDIETRQEIIDESNSITNQRNVVVNYINGHPDLMDMKTIEFVDDGYSGTNFDRPNFKKMMEMVKSGDISCIVVKDLSRFARNYIDSGEYLEHIFPLLGVRFIAINDNYDSNKYIGTTGGMDVAFRNYMHQLYSADISKKVKATQHMLMRKGKYVCHCPYGYTKPKGEKHRMIPDPTTAPIVRDIFLWTIYKRQIHIVSEQWHEEEKKQNQSQLPDLKTKHKSLSIQIKSLSREVASLYEQYRTGKLTREEFLEKKQLFSTEKEKLQAEISSVEENINTEIRKERAESASLQTLLDIASLAQEDDETLKSRMYDDIEKVIVFDNHTIDIRWKFDVDFKDNHT